MSQVQEFFSITPWTVIFSFCNLLLICYIIKKLLFKPVMNVLAKRQEEVDNIYKAADSDRAEAAQLKADYNAHMAEAKSDADKLMKNAMETANKRSEAIIGEAQQQASGMIRRAESEIEQERLKAFTEVRNELSEMAVDIAGQIVDREINGDDHKKLVDEFIRNAGEEQ